MLYDPKWEAPCETKPDLFSLDGLIVWLETKDPEAIYCYEASGACMLSQYFRENGFPLFHCGPFVGHWYGGLCTLSAACTKGRAAAQKL